MKLSQTTTTVVPFPTPAPNTPVTNTTRTPDQMVELYVHLRDKVAEIKEQHKNELSRYVLAMGKLEALLLDVLNTNNVESMRAKSGTFYKTKQVSVTVENWSDVLDYIRANGAWELLESRVSKTAVQSMLEDSGKLPPGVKINTMIDIGIRRAGKT
jgi:hypothetical protein